MVKERPIPACEGRHWLFESVNADDHRQARSLCVDQHGRPACPAFTSCEDTLRDLLASDHRSGVHGTWAGRLFSPSAEKAKRKAARK